MNQGEKNKRPRFKRLANFLLYDCQIQPKHGYGALATREADTAGGGNWKARKVSAETESKECQLKGCIVQVQDVFLSIFHNEAFLLLPPVLITDQCSQLSVTKLPWFVTY